MGGAYWRVGVAYHLTEVGAEDDLTRCRRNIEALPVGGGGGGGGSNERERGVCLCVHNNQVFS